MWAKYNFVNFPIVKVEFDGIIENNKDFTDFINEWKRLYDEKEILNLYLIQAVVDL